MNNDNTSILESLASIKTEFKHQKEANENTSRELEKLGIRLASLEATINQAKGGWLVIIAIPAIVTAVVNFLMKAH